MCGLSQDTAWGKNGGNSLKHIVGFSGGIDSQACARWVLNRFPKGDVILVNSDAGGHEHPITTEFVKWYSANIHPVVEITAIVSDLWIEGVAGVKPKVHVSEKVAIEKGFSPDSPMSYEEMMLLKGRGASSQARFCTDILKIRPQLRWIKANITDDFERYTGKRRDESRSRKETPAREWDGFYDCYLNHVLMDWTKKMCFDYVQAHGEPVNELYKMGFSRVGCAPCIDANKEDILMWATRAPERIDVVRGYEQRTGRTFFAPMVPGMTMNCIDDVVAWAKTSRGGRQQMFPILHERDTCESKYGLCE